jgi:hypothetical protein
MWVVVGLLLEAVARRASRKTNRTVTLAIPGTTVQNVEALRLAFLQRARSQKARWVETNRPRPRPRPTRSRSSNVFSQVGMRIHCAASRSTASRSGSNEDSAQNVPQTPPKIAGTHRAQDSDVDAGAITRNRTHGTTRKELDGASKLK